MPRFIIFVRGSLDSEAEFKPDPEMMKVMGEYNATMRKAGILLSVEGLHRNSRDSRRIVFQSSGPPTIQSGPFPADELVQGFWIVQVKDVNEAVAWAVKCPSHALRGNVTEVRRIASVEDFEDVKSPGLEEK